MDIRIAFLLSFIIVMIPLYFLGYKRLLDSPKAQKYIYILFTIGIFVGFIAAYFTVYLITLAMVYASSAIIFFFAIAIFHVLLIYIVLQSKLLPKKKFYALYGLFFSSGIAVIEGGWLLYLFTINGSNIVLLLGILYISAMIITSACVGYTVGALIIMDRLLDSIIFPILIFVAFYSISIFFIFRYTILNYISLSSALLFSIVFLVFLVNKFTTQDIVHESM